MPTTFWTGNGQNIAEVDTLTVSAVASGATLSATINGKSITYTCLSSDTTASAASALVALLQASGVPPEFQEMAWAISASATNVITATANTPGTPFTLTSSGAGGGTITHAVLTASSSESDVNNAANWLRSGSPSIPQNGDDVVLQNSSIPLLWNLSSLSAVQFNSFTRWQSFTGTVGLPENNPAGYYEYRPTYFQFTGAGAGAINVILGQQDIGSGPTRERYNVGGQQVNLVVLGAGSALDDYAIRFLGTHTSNTVSVLNTSVGVAMLPTETADLASATVDGGGTLDIGSGVTFSGTLTVTNGTSTVYCAPATKIMASNGSTVTIVSSSLTYANITAQGGSIINFVSNSTITQLTLQTSSRFNKSVDARGMTITNHTIDGDTCQIEDPLNTITFTNAGTVNGQVVSGPYVFTGPRSVKVT